MSRQTCMAVGVCLMFAVTCCSAHLPPAPRHETVRVCNLAQTVCAVSNSEKRQLTVQRVDGSEPSWTVPVHAAQIVVSKGGATVAVLAPPWLRARAASPFLTLYRRSGASVAFGYGVLYDQLLQTPEDFHMLSWGRLEGVGSDDDLTIRTVRDEVFRFSIKDED